MNDNFDNLRHAWAAQGGAFPLALAPRQARTPLIQLKFGIIFELVGNAIALVLLGAFGYDHRNAPQFLIPAAALDLYVIFMVQGLIRQLVAIANVQYWEPVTIVQRRFETVRRTRLLFTQITVALMALAWTPLMIVGLDLLGVDAYATLGTAYLAANVAFGIAFMAGFILIAKRFGEKLSQIPALAYIAASFEGYDLVETSKFLKEITQFEQEQA